jgi:hypothetical protein
VELALNNLLANLLNNSKVEKLLLTSTIRTMGEQGENILIQTLNTTIDNSLKIAILIVLSYRLPQNPKYLKIKLQSNTGVLPNRPSLPGTFCTYYTGSSKGKLNLKPVVIENTEDNIGNADNENSNISEKSEPYLEINSRDMIASLQRFILTSTDNSNPKITLGSKNLNILDSIEMFDALKVSYRYDGFFKREDIKSENMLSYHENGKKFLSPKIIQALIPCLIDYESSVRVTAATVLGQIGAPEALIAIPDLIKSSYNEDVNLKTEAIRSIGIFSPFFEIKSDSLLSINSLIKIILYHLDSNVWKVKASCLYAIGIIGHRGAKLTVPKLIKMLKNNNIKRSHLSDTLMKVGEEGEHQ